MQVPELSASTAKLRAAAENENKAEVKAPEITKALYAFAIVKAEDGRTLLYNTLDIPVVVSRTPSFDEILGDLAVVASDVNSEKIAAKAAIGAANATVSMLTGMGRQAAEQQANAAALKEAQQRFGA